VLGYVTRFPPTAACASCSKGRTGLGMVWYGSGSGVFNRVTGLPVLGTGAGGLCKEQGAGVFIKNRDYFAKTFPREPVLVLCEYWCKAPGGAVVFVQDRDYFAG